MSTQTSTVEYIVDLIQGAGEITYRKMFGEFGVYCDGKNFALVCDDNFYIKITKAGKSFAPELVECAPYTGAKNYFFLDQEIEDREWIEKFIQLTIEEIPVSKK